MSESNLLLSDPVLEIFDSQDVREVRRVLARMGAPRTPQELYAYIVATQGIFPAITVTDPENMELYSPFDVMVAVYFRMFSRIAAIGPRGGSKSFSAASVADVSLATQPNTEWVHASATRDQTEEMSKKMGRIASGAESENRGRAVQMSRSRIDYPETRSTWYSVPKTVKGISGYHPNVFSADELDFWEPAEIQQSLGLPVSSPEGLPPVHYAFSTRQRQGGPMDRLVKESQRKGTAVFRWTIFEAMKRCPSCVAIDENPYGTDAARMQSCLLWEECKGKRGVKSTGHIPREDLINMKLEADRDTWISQYLCELPPRTGSIFHNWLSLPSRDPRLGNLTDVGYCPGVPILVGFDPSEGQTAAFVFAHVEKGHVFFFDELVIPDCPDPVAAKEQFWDYCNKKGYLQDLKIIIVDPRRTDSMSILRRGSAQGEGASYSFSGYGCQVAGAPTTPEVGGQLLLSTINVVAGWLGTRSADGTVFSRPRLFVNKDTCPQIVDMFEGWAWKLDANKNPTTIPEEHRKDVADAVRYLMLHVHSLNVSPLRIL